MKLFLIPSLLAANAYDTIPQEVRGCIAQTKYYLVEDLRTARRFIGGFKLDGVVVAELNFQLLDKKTKPQDVANLFKKIPKGENVGVISEAGCPGIADPGALAVSYAHSRNIEVVPLSGPSSIFLALMASGFDGQHFAFKGYLPIKKGEKIKAIQNLEGDSSRQKVTQIFMETPYRNQAMFDDLLSHLSGQTSLCVASNITAEDQFIKSMTVKEWKKQKVELGKKPTIFIIKSY